MLGTVYVYPLRSCPNQSPTRDCVRWRRLLPCRQLLPVGNGMERTLFLHTIQRQRQSDSKGVRVTVTVSEIERVGQRLRQRNMKLRDSRSIEPLRSDR